MSAHPTTLEVLFTPADFAALKSRDLGAMTCVVFDVLRATSSMVTALAHGAKAIIPVETIAEALALRAKSPDLLLAGERDGFRIKADQTGGPDFDLGNSPREFTEQAVRARTIAMTTTNGTLALRACAGAQQVFASSFLNLAATAGCIREKAASNLIIVCSGTFEEAAFEDVLGAGALCDLLWEQYGQGKVADSALMARSMYLLKQKDLAGALGRGRNGRRLLSRPELRDDVDYCAQRNRFNLVAKLKENCVVRSEG